MATSNRATVFAKLYKVLKKHYEPVQAASRNVMENLLYACCLEDSSYQAANDCFARLQESYFDWNEVRVTTVRELGEVFKGIPNSTANALNLRNTLQSVFESQYSFDLEPLKKQNLGKAVALLESYKGTSQFTVAYVTQMNLGGHSIPLGKGGIDVMYIIGAIDEKEASRGVVPGLERAIPKNKGAEFGSLFHQLAADLTASPFSQQVRSLLLEIEPDCKERLPKRVDKKKLEAERLKKEEEERKAIVAAQEKVEAKARAAAKKIADKKKAEEKKAADAKQAVAKKVAAKKAEEKKVALEKKAAEKKSKVKAAPKKAAPKKAAAKVAKKTSKTVKRAAKKTSEKKTAKKASKKKVVKKKVVKKKIASKKASKTLVKKASTKEGKKSTSKQLARKKPR